MTTWAGAATIGPGWALFSGRAGDNQPHRHPALQLVLGDGQPVRAEVSGRRIEIPGLLIGSNIAHALQPGPVWLMYVERESIAGRRLAAACDSVRLLGLDECQALRDHWVASPGDGARVAGLVDRLVGLAAAPATVSHAATRVLRIIAALAQRPPESWSLAGMAAEAALSPSRFAHVFRAETGMPVRPYLRWLRLAIALRAAAQGGSLTEAAHRAGFADAAHLSRTMRRHFGVSPGSILGSLRSG
ncbi:MAG: AraC family transcriptional regulator [Anaerolineae bacterium]|nr:AraC family transcriptional regulator [Anaerolineae bacterium]